MTLSNVTLECFDDGDGSTVPPASPDFVRGFEAGKLHAMQDIQSQRQMAVADVSATLGDMAFGYAEARGALLEQIHPLMVQIGELILPEIAKETFAAHFCDTLTRAFQDATDQKIEVAVAPDMIAEVPTDGSVFTLIADPEMDLGQARLRRDDSHILIDFPTLLEDLQTALRGLDLTQRTHANG